MTSVQPHNLSSSVVPARFPIDDNFAIEFVDALAQQETYNKHHYRPNSYLHKWWARRCGTTFRAILKHLVADETLRDFYASSGLVGKIILDPMMGGGTTLHEAIRLGANVIGADIDPIPILQARATLTSVPVEWLTDNFDRLIGRLDATLGDLYATLCETCTETHPFQYILYGLRAACACRQVLVVDSLNLRHNSDDSIIHLDAETGDVYLDRQLTGKAERPKRFSIITKAEKQCPHCRCNVREDSNIPFYQRYEPLVVVSHCPQDGLRFMPVRAFDREKIARANAMRATLGYDSADFAITPGPKSDNLRQRGVDCYLDIFSSRQLLFLHHAIAAIGEFDPTTRLNFALLVSTALEFNAMLCGYKGALKSRPGAVRHTFTRHAYIFPYTALEVNPIFGRRASGTLRNLFIGRLLRGKRWSANPVERRVNSDTIEKVPINGETDSGCEVTDYADLLTGTKRFLLLQGSSADLPLPDDSVDFIVTDPPYFDSVQYGDLAAFFRVWLRQLLPEDVSWHYDLDTAAVDQHQNGNGQYSAVLSTIFSECQRVLRPNGRLIFTFHHWNPQAWNALTIALQQSGFQLVNRYVVHAESPTSIHTANQNALLHDVILVLKSAENGGRNWKLPTSVNRSDSRTFCKTCGTALGALLQSKQSPQQIATYWHTLLG